MLTETQQQLIDVMHAKAERSLAQRRTWIESGYKNYAASATSSRLEKETKAAFKAIVREWMAARNLTAFIRSELRVRYHPYPRCAHYQIKLGATSLSNGKAGLGNTSRWINKITVTPNGPRGTVRIRAHKARTDADFLEPTATEFKELIQAVVDALTQ